LALSSAVVIYSIYNVLRIVLGVNHDRVLDKTLSRLTPRTIRREPKNIINRINNLCGGERNIGYQSSACLSTYTGPASHKIERILKNEAGI
jgi:hypothetical protein